MKTVNYLLLNKEQSFNSLFDPLVQVSHMKLIAGMSGEPSGGSDQSL